MMNNNIKLNGTFIFKYLDKNRNLIHKEIIKNLTTTEGLNNFLDTYFSGDWYIGLKGSDETPLLTWTASQINTVFTEFTDYTESTRQLWDKSSASSGQISNLSSFAEFTISADNYLYGAFLTNNSAKNSTSGVLYSCSNLSVVVPVFIDGIVQFGYIIKMSN